MARSGDSLEVTVEDQHLAEQVQRVVGTLGMVEAIEPCGHYEAQTKQIRSAGNDHKSKDWGDEDEHHFLDRLKGLEAAEGAELDPTRLLAHKYQ